MRATPTVLNAANGSSGVIGAATWTAITPSVLDVTAVGIGAAGFILDTSCNLSAEL